MVVALITLELRLQARTLKEKRMLVKSLLSRLRQRHNLSVHEAGHQDFPGRSRLAAAWVGPDPDSAQRVLESVLNLAEQAGAQVLSQELELF